MFSEVCGYKSEQVIQYECITVKLRQRIWNLFYQEEIVKGGLASGRLQQALNGEQTIESKIADILGFSISSTVKGESLQSKIENYLLIESEWYEVYDFIEIHMQCTKDEEKSRMQIQYNNLLEYEKSGYRLINGVVSSITNKLEITSIEEATTTELSNVNQHIQKALALYADLENPDYENSIKESISAVETMCCKITGMAGANATLGKALKKLQENDIYIHTAMERAFSSLYGYASDEDGIRHGGMDFVKAPAEDAKYMLVSCSAFVNYLSEKLSKLESEKNSQE